MTSKLNDLSQGRLRLFLLENVHRSITSHNLKDCFQLLKIVPKDVSLDPYILFRLVFILIESSPTENIDKNLVGYLESMLSKLDVGKVDIFIEFISYFIRNGRIEDATDLFVQRRKAMNLRYHRQLPYVELNLKCYEFLLNYLQWKQTAFDLSIQGWLVNAIADLKSTTGNYEYFVICVLRVLLFYGLTKKAYLLAYGFARHNPSNLSAQLLLHNIIEQFSPHEAQIPSNVTVEDLCKNRLNDLESINNYSTDWNQESIDQQRYPLEEDKKNVLKNLKRIDPSRVELIQLNDDKISILESLLDGLEVLSEVRNMDRWRSLNEVLDDIFLSNDEVLKTDACFLWQTKYKRFWSSVSFLKITGRIKKQQRNLITKVTERLYSELDRPIKQY